MWALKIKVREKWDPFNSRTLKFKVKGYFYSQNFYEKNNKIYFVGSGILEGDENSKKKFFSDLKKDKKMNFIEVNENFFIFEYFEPKTSERGKNVMVAYNPRLIHLKPVIIDSEGWEDWEIASTIRKDLEDFLTICDKLKIENKIIYFKEQKIKNLMIKTIFPKLTERQRQALILAVENNYYGYPRKTKMEHLAKMMGISLSTYQFHLAKAEAKIIPFLAKNY